MPAATNCPSSLLQCTFTPFKDEFNRMLEHYGQDRDSHKRLAASVKNLSATFSLTGSFLLVVVWSVGGANIKEPHGDNVWGSASDAGNTVYRCLTTCASILCILLVGTTTRTYLLLDMMPLGGHRDMVVSLGHFHTVGLPYFLFGIILVLIGFSIALQATLNNDVIAGCLVGSFLMVLTFRFISYWMQADSKLMAALNTCVVPPVDVPLAVNTNGPRATV